MNKIESTLKTYLSGIADSTVVTIALSGGRDSIVLLHAVHAYFAKMDKDLCNLRAVHVNHGISSQSSVWENFCHELCNKLGVHLESHQVTVNMQSSAGIEAAARDERYKVFKAQPSGVILLAQHKNDQAETFLFNILRGCSVSSAGGMPVTRNLRPDLVLHRPLLNVLRKDIDAYCTEHALTWVEDDSNTDTSYSRNFIRHDVIPMLNKTFASIENRLVSTAERFDEAASLLDDLAEMDLGEYSAVFPLPVSVFAALPEKRSRNLLRYVLNKHGLASLPPAQMSQAINQFVTAKPDRHPEVKVGNFKLVRIKKMICLEPM